MDTQTPNSGGQPKRTAPGKPASRQPTDDNLGKDPGKDSEEGQEIPKTGRDPSAPVDQDVSDDIPTNDDNDVTMRTMVMRIRQARSNCLVKVIGKMAPGQWVIRRQGGTTGACSRRALRAGDLSALTAHGGDMAGFSSVASFTISTLIAKLS